jgi:3-phosphoshikimate 1-carboxyvinyltransferase
VSGDALAIRPMARPPAATIAVPGSKSITNRALLLAALAEGRSVLSGALSGDDTRYMIDALGALGVPVDVDAARGRIAVEGCGGRWPVRDAELFVGNAGTAMRFLTAALCLGDGQYRITGSARMQERPIGELVEALRQLGADVTCSARGTPPVAVAARGLRGGPVTLSAERSSQFLSALLMVAPYATGDVAIALRGDLIAQPYVDMTIAVMAQWGAAVASPPSAQRRFTVAANQRYRAQSYAVEPDASSAHYFWAAAALTAGTVRVPGVGNASLQGDVAFAALLGDMGAAVDAQRDHITVTGRAPLRGVDRDLNAFSDTVPTLAVLAPFAADPVRIRNVAHLRWQESDRLHAVATELTRLGAAVRELDDGLEIEPSALHSGTVETYDDHRIAMAFALIGLKIPGIRIDNPGCVAKTFPEYFERLEMLRR